jgi:hypothetical protein
MRRPAALAAALALSAFAGCGYSSAEQIKDRDPPGGQDRGPDVHNRMVDELRTMKVTVAARRFQPQQVTVGLDSTVQIVNETRRPVELRVTKLVGHPLEDTTLEPGERIEREYLRGGTELIGLRGSRARLEINVYATP